MMVLVVLRVVSFNGGGVVGVADDAGCVVVVVGGVVVVGVVGLRDVDGAVDVSVGGIIRIVATDGVVCGLLVLNNIHIRIIYTLVYRYTRVITATYGIPRRCV